jgi:hypothetical protein
MTISRGVVFWAAGLGGLVLLAAGCGGISNAPATTTATTTTVIAEVEVAGTTNLLPVAASLTAGGVNATSDVKKGWAMIPGVPIADPANPQAPLTASAPGYVTTSQMLTLSTYSYTTVTVSLTPADVTKTGTVGGTITVLGKTTPLANAVVTFTPPGGTAVTGFTDNAGHYQFTGLPTGSETVTAALSGYVQATKQVSVVADSKGKNAAVNLALLGGSTLVTVTGQARQLGPETPVAGAQVQIGTRPAVTTDANGNFSVPSVPVGSQTLTATAIGYDNKTLTLAVLPGMTPVDVEMTTASPNPPPGPYTITGTVTLLGKSDNSGATVTALNTTTGQVMDTETTNAAGAYYLFVPPGPYTLTVTYGIHSLTTDVVLLGGGRVLTGINLELSVGSG